jgi:hypothetical protein
MNAFFKHGVEYTNIWQKKQAVDGIKTLDRLLKVSGIKKAGNGFESIA